MTAPGYRTTRGDETRARIEQALLAAGAAGLRKVELVTATGLRYCALDWHLSRMADCVYVSRSPIAQRRRIYHVQHADAASAAMAAQADRATPRQARPWCGMRRIERVLVQAGSRGALMADLMRETGLSRSSCESALATLRHAGAITSRRNDDHTIRMRYFAAANASPPAAPPKAAARASLPRKPVNVTPTRKLSAPAISVQAEGHGLQLAPGARIITGPNGARAREEALQRDMHPLFSAMRPGQYLEHDNAIARAYGARGG